MLTFSLTGFNTVRREGIQLSAGFTASVNADLQVGSLAETITVSGASPLVDTQSVRQQQVVSSDLLDALPSSSRALVNLINLTPDTADRRMSGGALGTYRSMQPGGAFHGKTGFKVLFDGMRTNNLEGSGSQGYIPNAVLVEETTLETGGVSAESAASGTLTNMIPKEGGNTFRGSLLGLYTDDRLQSNNLSDEVRARGLTTVDKVLNMHDAAATLGGRVIRDKLWFFTAHRRWGNRNQIAGVFWNKTQGTPFYTPDLERPADRLEYYRSHAVRVTWQASEKQKFNFFTDVQSNCDCRHTFSGFAAPEAIGSMHFWPNFLSQATWSSPLTSRVLLEAGASAMISHWPTRPQPGVSPTDIGTVELSTGFRYGAETGFNRFLLYGDRRISDRYAQRFSASYVTGSHAFKAAGVMGRQVAQMVRLVEDLFDISRLGQDKLSIRRVPVDLASVVHHAVETSAPLLENAGLNFAATLPPTPIYIDADAGRLAQVIGNILNNASKFTPRGGAVTLSVEAEGEQAVIHIRDTGIGIDPEQLPHIFEMFMQADLSLADRGGLGLGLTLAKSLMERHGGQIHVQSAGLGHGAEFTLRLPRLSVAPESVARAFGPVPRQPLQPEKKRVLVVDDNKDSTSMMSMLLECAGHEVRVADDGPDAVEAVAAFQPHVVLLDIGLPTMNGYEVAQRIRQQGGMQPVLAALTGWGQTEDRLKSSAAGFDVHLVKPVEHDVLTTLINDAPMTGRS